MINRIAQYLDEPAAAPAPSQSVSTSTIEVLPSTPGSIVLLARDGVGVPLLEVRLAESAASELAVANVRCFLRATAAIIAHDRGRL
jgi:hypothetical protein